MRTRCRTWLATAETQKSINGWLAWAWFIYTCTGVITYAAGWPLGWMARSIPVLFFMSGYANVAGHWSGWQGGRTEVKQDKASSA